MIVKEPPRSLNKVHILYLSAVSTVVIILGYNYALMIAGVEAM